MTTLTQREGEPSAYHLARGTWPHAALAHAHLELPMDPSAAATARRELERGFAAYLDGDEERLMKLLVSELVTNAVRHSGAAPAATIGLRVALAATCIRVEVGDAGAGFRPAETPMPRRTGQGGWGLFIVNVEASRWGASSASGSCVWFELDRGAGAERAA